MSRKRSEFSRTVASYVDTLDCFEAAISEHKNLTILREGPWTKIVCARKEYKGTSLGHALDQLMNSDNFIEVHKS